MTLKSAAAVVVLAVTLLASSCGSEGLQSPAGWDATNDDYDFTPLMGLSLDEATVLANEAGWVVRHCDYDVNEVCAMTLDINPERISLSIYGGVVTRAVAG